MARTVTSPAVVTAAFAGTGTLLIALAPGVEFAYWAPSLHAAIESSAAIFSVLVAYVIACRFARSHRLSDLWLLGALGVLATTNLVFSAVPAITGGVDMAPFPWLRAAGSLMGAIALTCAAFTPDVEVRNPRREAASLLAGLAAALVLLAVGAAVVGLHSPLGPDPNRSDVPQVGDWDTLAVLHLFAMSLFALAAVGFARRARVSTDALIVWLAVGSTLSAFARLHYLLFPAVDPNWVFTRDVLRFSFYLVLLAGALRDVRGYQRRVAAEAAIEERRRMARDLHDGLAQELAFISMQSRLLAERSGEQAVGHIADAADHALHGSRAAIAVLMCPAEASLDTAVAEVAQHLTSRCGVNLRLDLDPRAELSDDGREHLLRILREAVWNALHHGRATSISVQLTCEDGMRLRISDNGVGFDPEAALQQRRGLGLMAMAERTRALGGELRLQARPGAGTEVEVVLR
jgi:signal transduction histidine kinase